MTPKQAATALIENRAKHRVGPGNRCPICNSDSWCLASEQAVLCPRAGSEGSVGKFGEYGHLFLTGNGAGPAVEREPKPPRKTDREQDAIWRPQVEQWRQTDRLPVLEGELGVTGGSLAAIWTGWAEGYNAWTVPEWSHRRAILGVSLRYPGGRKLFIAGGRRGLTFPEDWLERAAGAKKRVVLVEGASDVAAGLDYGWSAIGRPSNTGGAAILASLLGGLSREFQVIVFGENDRKQHDSLPEVVRAKHNPKCRGCATCWPGLWGAQTLVETLNKRLRCRVVKAMPTGAKDVRSMLARKA